MDNALVNKVEARISKGTKNRIYRVGGELEGGWEDPPATMNLDHDGSVKGLAKSPTCQRFAVGELVSQPLPPISISRWIKKWYPQKVNATCGLHVHVSFLDARHYQALMTKDFPPLVTEMFARWAAREGLPATHPIWPRLRGESEFCQHKYWPKSQANRIKKDREHHAPGCRYTSINYCFKRYATIECRLLPMFDTKEQAIRAVQHFLDICNAAIIVMSKKEAPFVGEVFMDEEKIVKKSIEKVVRF